jgi:hypothetical protein
MDGARIKESGEDADDKADDRHADYTHHSLFSPLYVDGQDCTAVPLAQ